MPSFLPKRINSRSAILIIAGSALCTASLANADVIYQQDFENGWSNADGNWSTNTNSALGGPFSTVLGRFGNQTATLNIAATSNGSTGDNPFNVTVDQFANNQSQTPMFDQGGGGGPGGSNGVFENHNPWLDLGQAIQDSNTNPGPPMFGVGTYAIHFDAILFDSWDGDDSIWGADSIAVAINGQTLFDEFFYNSTGSKTTWESNAVISENAFSTEYIEHVYRDVQVIVELTQEIDHLTIDFMGKISQNIDDESWGIDNILVEKLTSTAPASLEVPAPGTLALLGTGIGMMIRRKR